MNFDEKNTTKNNAIIKQKGCLYKQGRGRTIKRT